MEPAPKGLDLLSGGAATHSDDDGPRHDRVGEIAEPGERHSRIGRDFLGDNGFPLHSTAACNAAAPMASIQQSSDFLVLLRLRSEYGVDLVKEDRRQALFGGDLP